MIKVQVIVLCCVFWGASAWRPRLTNNNVAGPGEFPYQVSFQVDDHHICGGALVSDKHVVTAAHCVCDIILRKLPKERMKISVGSNNLNGGMRIGVERLAFPKTYSPGTLMHDIAVITLKTPITKSATVRPIALPKGEVELTEQTDLIVSGFGSGMLNGPGSRVLKKMTMHVMSRAKCHQFWPQLIWTHMCARAPPGHGTCSGDSGGPLTLNKEVLVGVVSGGSSRGCGAGIGDLFTKVSTALNFIKREMAR